MLNPFLTLLSDHPDKFSYFNVIYLHLVVLASCDKIMKNKVFSLSILRIVNRILNLNHFIHFNVQADFFFDFSFQRLHHCLSESTRPPRITYLSNHFGDFTSRSFPSLLNINAPTVGSGYFCSDILFYFPTSRINSFLHYDSVCSNGNSSLCFHHLLGIHLRNSYRN